MSYTTKNIYSNEIRVKPYTPRGVFRNGHSNSIISGSIARKLVVHRDSEGFLRQAKEEIIHTGNDIRLMAFINQQPNTNAPLIILLHGWLGCAESLYLVSLGNYLFENGYHVVRLNFRDHGNTEHLNKNLFHSCRIQEVINACIYLQNKFKTDTSIIGFSLGANFALRVNAFTTDKELALYKTISICPVIDPMSTLNALEQSLFVYQHYFMQRWKYSFNKKAQTFPKIYTKEHFNRFSTLREATEDLATHYAGFDSLEAYLNGYSIAGNRLNTLHAPAHAVLAKDDPIIPWKDCNKLTLNENLHVNLSDHGGHCGFLEPNIRSTWINEFCLSCLDGNR